MLPPELKVTAGKRHSRRPLTYPEHMCGFLKMLLPTLDPLSETHAALKHAAQVSQDTATLPWQAVRQWTQSCMAYMEDKDATWHDQELFTNERTRLSWIQGRQLLTRVQHTIGTNATRGKRTKRLAVPGSMPARRGTT